MTAATGRHARAWWLGVGTASVVVWAALTWPFLLRLGDLWQWSGDVHSAGQAAFTVRDGSFHSADHLQNIFIDSVIVDNARELREPYLDLREGAAGPSPLRTTSLNLPWTPVIALLWPVVGLVGAYNSTLLLSSVATALAMFGLLRRHTRWPLLAAAGALLYAASPHRMFQLTVHFNAVMWWAFPAAAWAFEAMVDRWRAARVPTAPPVIAGASVDASVGASVDAGAEILAGTAAGPAATQARRRGWGWPALGLAAVILTVGVGGEYHLALFMIGLVCFLVAWALLAARVRREPLPLRPAAVALAAVAAACAYVIAAFSYVFQGSVEGGNGSWTQVMLYAASPGWLVRKAFGEGGEGLVYVGWVVLTLAIAGLVVAIADRRARAALPYAVLLPVLVFATFGPRLASATFQPYRTIVEQIPFLSFQRVPQRLMVVTAMVLTLLAVVAADRLGRLITGSGEASRRALRVGAVAAVVVTALVLADYRVSRNLLFPSETGNAVVERLAADGDAAGPVLGLPAPGKTSNFNAATTYIAAISRRRTLNAYNQTSAPWLDERLATLWPLTGGQVTEPALAVLRQTGTRHIVVVDEARMYPGGEWRAVIDRLTASGRFRLVEEDGPMALLELLP